MSSLNDKAVGVGAATVVAFILMACLGLFLWWMSAVARLREKGECGIVARRVLNADAIEDGEVSRGGGVSGGGSGGGSRGVMVESNRRRRSYWGDKDSLLRHPLSAFINKPSSPHSSSLLPGGVADSSPFHMIGGGLSLSSHSAEFGTDSTIVSFRKIVTNAATTAKTLRFGSDMVGAGGGQYNERNKFDDSDDDVDYEEDGEKIDFHSNENFVRVPTAASTPKTQRTSSVVTENAKSEEDIVVVTL